MVFWLFLSSLWLSVAFSDYHKLLVSLLNLTVVYSVAVQELSVGFFVELLSESEVCCQSQVLQDQCCRSRCKCGSEVQVVG